MKNLLSIISILTITTTGISTLIPNNKIQSNLILVTNLNKLFTKNNLILLKLKGGIFREDAELEVRPRTWGNNFIIRFSDRLMTEIRNSNGVRNTRDIISSIVVSLGLAGVILEGSAIARALGVTAAIGGYLAIILNRWNDNPEAFRNFFIYVYRGDSLDNGNV